MLRLAAAAGLPALLASGVLLWVADGPTSLRVGAGGLVLALWVAALLRLRVRLTRPLRSIANVLTGLRRGDLALRATDEDPGDPLGLVAHEANRLADRLRERRLDAREREILLERVMEEIDAAVFAFDDELRLRLVNRTGASLLDADREELHGRRADDLELGPCLEPSAPEVLETSFPGTGPGRWEVSRSTFRLEGRPHRLLVLSDVAGLLRREERRAWRQLIRVLSHEINNSLAPVCSVADSLRSRAAERSSDDGEGGELERGLELIARRARSLNSFLDSYARVARLPDPEPEVMDVGEWIRGVVELETRRPVEVVPGPSAGIRADPDQMQQLLVNLLDNAVKAAAETDGSVRVEWSADGEAVEVRVVDEGPGLADDANLFVPFFSTKEDGTGVGLALSREIVHAHGGTITLQNRTEGRGCVARVRLPRES